MIPKARWVALGLFLSYWAMPAGATVLYVDMWQDGDQVAVELGNCPGECDAVVLTPPSYPFDVNYVYAIGGPDGSNLTFDVKIVAVDQGEPDLDTVLGGADGVDVYVPTANWFELDLTALGTPATIASGQFAVAICFLEENSPCYSWGLGADDGPPIIPDGGYIYADMGQYCNQAGCGGGSDAYAWYTLSSFGAPRNWILRASDVHWEPGQPTDDDDDDDDDDAADDDTGGDDDDDADDDTGDDDTGQTEELDVNAITPDVINEGDLSGFQVTGVGFQDGADLRIGNLFIMPIDVESGTVIEGAFPEGLTTGYYDVCVENPDNEEDCLMGGLHVVSSSGCGNCSSSSPGATSAAAGASITLLFLFGGLLIARRRP